MSTAVTLVNGASLAWGIASDEVGVNIGEFKQAVAPQFIESLGNRQNVTRCDAYAPPELTLTMSGETNGAGAGSVLLSTIGVAFVPVNALTTLFNAPTTGLYLQSGGIDLSRSGWVSFNTEHKAKAGIP